METAGKFYNGKQKTQSLNQNEHALDFNQDFIVLLCATWPTALGKIRKKSSLIWSAIQDFWNKCIIY